MDTDSVHPIPDFEGYFATYDGRVFSNRRGGTLSEVKSYCRPRDGYLQIALSTGSKRVTCSAHRLILAAFVGPCPDGCEAHHVDGNRANNHIDNLKWITKSENHKAKVARGNWKNPNEKYSNVDYAIAASLHGRGYTLREIALETGVSFSHVRNMVAAFG